MINHLNQERIMSIMEKVRAPKLRPPTASPKERQAWDSFVELAEQMQKATEPMSSIVQLELDRLCGKGNPLAIRFRERLAISQFKPRQAEEPTLPPPTPRRISALQWLHKSVATPSPQKTTIQGAE